MHAKQCRYINKKKTSFASFRYYSIKDSPYHLSVFFHVQLNDDLAKASNSNKLKKSDQLKRNCLNLTTRLKVLMGEPYLT